MKNIKILVICSFIYIFPIFADKRALIFGVSGQDGIYLTEFLIKKGYEVHGVSRMLRTSSLNHLYQMQTRANKDQLILQTVDIIDPLAVQNLIQEINPDEIYNLAAQSNVKASFNSAFVTAQINALGTLNILEAIRVINPSIRFYQASSSEMFGKTKDFPQNETTVFNPQSPYAIAKLYSYWITINYRNAYGIYACNGILFNHESPLREESFVTRKITRSVARIHCGLQDTLYLGNLNAKRDWGYAKDYVEAMWMMLQQDNPSDYVIATGKNHSVREFVENAFKCAGIEIMWQGSGVNEKGFDRKTKKLIVAVDPEYFRPTEVDCSVGDATKAQNDLNWRPTIDFETLVSLMVEHDLNDLKNQG